MIAERVGCTVDELLDRISSKEITEWIAYFKIRQEEEKKAIESAKRRR